MPIKPAVELHASQGEYLRYILKPRGDRANMTFADRARSIITDADFQNQDRLEWRLQSAAQATGNIALTVRNAAGDTIGTYIFTAAAGSDRSYELGLQFVNAVSYELQVDRLDGSNQVVEALGTVMLAAPPNLQGVGISVFLEN